MHSTHRSMIRVSFRVAASRRDAGRCANVSVRTRTCFTAYIPQDRIHRHDTRLVSRKTLNHRRPVAIFQSCLCRVALITSGFVPCASGDNNENKEVEGVDFNLYANTGATKPLLIVALGSYSIISPAIRGPAMYGPSNLWGIIVVRNAFPLLWFHDVIILSSNFNLDNIVAIIVVL